MIDKKILKILCCPKCKGKLCYNETNQNLICESCMLKYPVKDDVPVMLIAEAEEYNVSNSRQLQEALTTFKSQLNTSYQKDLKNEQEAFNFFLL